MGVYLKEYVSKDAFLGMDIDNIINEVSNILFEFGESGTERIEMFGKSVEVINPLRFDYEESSKRLVFSYNRFEKSCWEPTYMNLEKDEFSGIRSWALGSKVGFSRKVY